jgi:hypothetical protein
LLLNGKVLVAGGIGAAGVTNAAEIFDPAGGTWKPAGTLNTARYAHTATLLPNGKVLVAGGFAATFSASAELFDPISGTWTNTGSLNTPRYYHTATLLPNGKVLVTGGQNTSGYLTNSEVYDPASGVWSVTGSLNVGRVQHAATLLPNGKVLAVDGYKSAYLSSAEMYDPATGTWMTNTPLSSTREYQTATLLPNGKILVTGGFGSMGATNATELYDPGLGYPNTERPQIASITSPLSLGGRLVATGAQFGGISGGSSGNTQDSATGFPLVQLRGLESGQTLFLSSTNWSTNTFASMVVTGFPPGYALATVFAGGIQSTSSLVNVSVPLPATTTLTGVRQVNGVFWFNFTNNPGAIFGVLATTNLSLPQSNWTRLGGVVEPVPGQFQFNDPQATNGGRRFYNLFAP